MRDDWRRAIPPATRFWIRVWPKGDCWQFRSTRCYKGGYRFFTHGGRNFLAHRIAYQLAKGLLPPGLTVDHLCRHPWCVRPSHLEAVPGRTNILRGRGITAQNAKKTHCLRGHPFDAQHMYLYRGYRICHTCRKMRDRLRARRYRKEHGKRINARRRALYRQKRARGVKVS